MIRLASEGEVANWDDLVLNNPDGGHIYQSKEWCSVKEANGWEPVYCIYEATAYVVGFVLLRKAVSILGNIYYCSKGPGFFKDFSADKNSKAHFQEFINDLKPFIARYDTSAILVKIEPELAVETDFEISKLGLVKSKADLQFKATIFVDISGDEETLISGLKQKTRYNIRLAKRKEVKIEKRPMDQAGVDLMYELMNATQKRAGFFLRQKSYFKTYWQGLADADMGQLLVATHDGDVLGGVFVTIFGTKAYYKDGGSFEVKRNLMAPYLLQWEAMMWAKQKGASSYDMVAVPPKSELDNPSHSQYGLYQFKRMFSEEVTEFVGCWDMPINLKKFKIWNQQESYYLRLYAKIKKNLFW